MGKQNNFKEAVNELMSGKITSSSSDVTSYENSESKYKEPSKGSLFGFDSSRNEYAPKSGGTSIIAEDLIIEGSVFGDSTIQINGRIKGNVTSSRDIISRGIIEGDTKGANITLSHSNIKGNVTASQHLSVDNESMILGNIAAGSVEINGRIKGDIRTEEVAVLRKSALILGNLTAKSVSMEAGAGIKGRMDILTDTLSEKDFKFENISNLSGKNFEEADTESAFNDNSEE